MNNDRSHRLSVREFQVSRPATEEVRRPYVDLLKPVPVSKNNTGRAACGS